MTLIRTRAALEAQEAGYLAPYAQPSAGALREHAEPAPETRTHFQRDWHRITHCRAFRKLEYKTQVVVFGEGGEMGDVIRNRLTHTLEVSQVATSICRSLGLSEDLASAIALAHDLGHTPFGHSGEDALRELVDDFNHNDHSLKLVRQLEHRYGGFDGLNLSLPTLAGIEKHDLAPGLAARCRFEPGLGPSLEAQVASLADEIAYLSHDVEDSLLTGCVTEAQYAAADLQLWRAVSADLEDAPAPVRLAQLTRRLINTLAGDALLETARRIEARDVRTLGDVHRAEEPLAGFSAPLAAAKGELRAFLYAHFYKNYRVLRGTVKGQMIIRRLFRHFTAGEAGSGLSSFDPSTHGWMLLPDDVRPHHLAAQRDGADRLGRTPVRIVADFIAGMTDREAYSLYVRLFEVGHG